MSKILTFILVLTLCLSEYALEAIAVVLNVPADHPTIQAAIDSGEDGDTVLVQAGTYFEKIVYYNKNVMVGSLFLTTGDKRYITSTIIDADSSGTVVGFWGRQSKEAFITGFTIQHGYGDKGGGISCYGSNPTISYCVIVNNFGAIQGGGISCDHASPYIDHCVVTDNKTPGEGGGIYCNRSNATISYCTITGNSAAAGGGINCAYGSRINISHCIISGNSVEGSGGGITIEFSSNPTLSYCIINNNSAGRYGGGIYGANDVNVAISNCLISENRAGRDGGFLWCAAIVRPAFVNCTIFGNSAQKGGGAFIGWTTELTIVNSIIRSNTPHEIVGGESNTVAISHSNIGGGLAGITPNYSGKIDWGEGNIDADPQFVNPADGNFHIIPDSPCIDTGIDADFQFLGSAPDMGVFEFGQDDFETGAGDGMCPPGVRSHQPR